MTFLRLGQTGQSSILNWTGSKMGVRLTNVTQLPPLTRPSQSAPKSHCQKNPLKNTQDMETFYGQNRRNFHTIRLSDEEELFVFAKMKELGYYSISAFIRDAILDEKLKVEICQDPVKYDYSHSIRQLITAIPVLDKRWARAEKDFVNACNIPGVDPDIIHRHANRIRRIVVELVNKLEYLTKLLGESHEKK